MFNKLLLAVALIAMSLAMSFSPTRAAELNGAGATLTYPLLTKWFSVYKPAKVVYQPTGNDSVFPRLKDKTIDFGGRDTPFSADALRELPFPVVQMPIVATATAITYNLPNLKKPLRLSDQVLVDIFLGKITRWNDAQLRVLNVGATLPNLPITLFRRPTQNASTQAVNVYLSAVSREWREKYGEMEVSKWPVGRGERSGSGTAWDLRDKPGGMAYMELAFATQQNLPMAEMRNRDGVFVAPSLDGVFHAIKHSIPALQRDLLAPIADARGAKSYPISSFSYVVFARQSDNTARQRKLLDLFTWMNNRGQSYAKPLLYAPLPLSLRHINARTLRSLQRELNPPVTTRSSTR